MKDYEFINILGVGKNGTTLLGSLLDNHNKISTFPMEMKFVEHYYNSIKDKSIKGFINFIFYKSKLSLLSQFNNSNISKKKIAKVVVGNLNNIFFDKLKFKKIVDQNKREILKEKNLKKILIFLHKCLDIYLKKKISHKIVIQDGSFGLRYINEQIRIFKKIKFIIIVRDPLDVYVSQKKICRKFKLFRRFIGDFSPEEYNHISRDQINYKIINNLFLKYKNNKKFYFIKYENLANAPKYEMQKLAKFLGVKYSKNLIRPTVFGQKWLGNSSRFKDKVIIDTREIDKYKKFLNQNEISFLELKFKYFYKNFKYTKKLEKFSTIESLLILFKVYFQNIKNAKKQIPKKKFLLKYLYYLFILNNLFLLRNLNILSK